MSLQAGDTDTSSEDGGAVPTAGTQLGVSALDGKYQLDRIIASGGMGVVLRARHRHLGTEVAVKLLHLDASATARRRFQREAKLAAAFDSPNLVRVFDYGFGEDGTPYLVMEYLEGRTLRARLREGRIPLVEAERLARQLVDALAEVHGAGVVHRDLKPSNLFLCPGDDGRERIKVIDFGIAKRLSEQQESGPGVVTATGEVLGTLRYMAPEQLLEPQEVDARADVWSAAAVIYEMLAGEPPFARSTAVAALVNALRDEPALPAPLPDTIAEPLRSVVRRCLARDPAERFDSGITLQRALVPGHLALAGRDDLVVDSNPPRSPRSKGVAAVFVTVVVAILALGGIALREEEPASAENGLADALPTVRARPKPASIVEAAASASSVGPKPNPAPFVRPRPQPPSATPRFDDRH